jgi:hypothetical protein
MPNIPNLEMPDTLSAYGRVVQNVQGSFAAVAEGLKQYGIFKHEGEVKEATAKELDLKYGDGTGAAYNKAMSGETLDKYTQGLVYLQEYNEGVSDVPDKKTLDVKTGGVYAAKQTLKDPSFLEKHLAFLHKDAATKQNAADVSKTQEQLSGLSKGLTAPVSMHEEGTDTSAGGVPKEYGTTAKPGTPEFIGRTISAQAKAENRPVFTQDFAQGVEKTDIPLSQKTGPQVAEANKQFISQENYDAQQQREKKLGIEEKATGTKTRQGDENRDIKEEAEIRQSVALLEQLRKEKNEIEAKKNDRKVKAVAKFKVGTPAYDAAYKKIEAEDMADKKRLDEINGKITFYSNEVQRKRKKFGVGNPEQKEELKTKSGKSVDDFMPKD